MVSVVFLCVIAVQSDAGFLLSSRPHRSTDSGILKMSRCEHLSLYAPNVNRRSMLSLFPIRLYVPLAMWTDVLLFALLQYAFAYFYWIMEGGAQEGLPVNLYWQRELDTNQDGYASVFCRCFARLTPSWCNSRKARTPYLTPCLEMMCDFLRFALLFSCE